MDRRRFLENMGIAAASLVLPNFAVEQVAQTEVPLTSRSIGTPSQAYSFDYEYWRGTDIRIVGVGSAGGNTLERMIREGIQNVKFIAINTDSQALARNIAPVKVQLGNTGLSTFADPEVGRAAAEDRAAIRACLDGAHMLFITAGMGGGTGTGAAPVIAEVARELGILTVGIVTMPFNFEGINRTQHARAGIAELSKHTDSLIIVSNERLQDVLREEAGIAELFSANDGVIKNSVSAITDIFTYHPSLVGVDFEDIRTVMGNKGIAKMGSAIATGSYRARCAAEQAITALLMDDNPLSRAHGILVNITAAKFQLKMKEINDALDMIKAHAADYADIIFGSFYDETMGDALRVTVFAIGQKVHHWSRSAQHEEVIWSSTFRKMIRNGGVEVEQIRRCSSRPF